MLAALKTQIKSYYLNHIRNMFILYFIEKVLNDMHKSKKGTEKVLNDKSSSKSEILFIFYFFAYCICK